MHHKTIINPFIYLIAAISVAVASCKKDNSLESGTTTEAATTSTITVAASNNLRTTDSLYIIQPCPRGTARDSIAQSALPAGITSYLDSNYAGYTFGKAYSIHDNNGVVSAYVAIIYFNDKPVGLAFNSNGEFVKVLEQREKGDLQGKGWHHGGRFEDRGGIISDTVSLNALPATITAYFGTSNPADTLLKAFTNRNGSYIVLSKNNGLFASLFDSTGSFTRRWQLPSKPGIYKVKDQANLPAGVLGYLDTSYPDYTLKKAFVLLLNGSVKAYIVIIDANSTRYALEFDAKGSFVDVKTIF